MKTAIIIHGMPSKEEYEENNHRSMNHWFQWLKNKLIEQGIQTITPEMPIPYNPEYEAWKAKFEENTIDENTILVGHSCGGGFIVRWLSENKDVHVGKVVLVAPWIDPEHLLNTGMFDFEIDPILVSRTKGLVVMYSTDDDKEILDTVKILKEKISSAEFQEFTDKGHFCIEDLGTETFPELLTNLNLI
jgi:predicted alpha/beta hydrolase family esterase